MNEIPEPLLEAVRHHVGYARRMLAAAVLVGVLIAASGPVLGALACLGKGDVTMFFVLSAVPIAVAVPMLLFVAGFWVVSAPKDEATHPLLRVLRERPDEVRHAQLLTFVMPGGAEVTHLRLALYDGSVTSVALPPGHEQAVAASLEGCVPDVIWKVA